MAKQTTMIIPLYKLSKQWTFCQSFLEFLEYETIMHFVCWTLAIKTTLALPYFL